VFNGCEGGDCAGGVLVDRQQGEQDFAAEILLVVPQGAALMASRSVIVNRCRGTLDLLQGTPASDVLWTPGSTWLAAAATSPCSLQHQHSGPVNLFNLLWKVFQLLQAFSHQFARSSREAISRKPSSDAVFKTRSRDLVRQFSKAGPFASIH